MKSTVVKSIRFGIVFVCCLSLLNGCANSPIRNPLKAKPKVVLGPLPDIQAQSEAQFVWQQRTTRGAGDYAKITPLIVGDVVYQADDQGFIVALDKHKGERLWRKSTQLPIASGPVLIDQKLFVGTRDGQVAAFDPTTGDALWRASVPSEVLAPPQGNARVILVNTIDGQLSALNPQTGDMLWQYQRVIPALTLRGQSAPGLTNDEALAGFASGKFVALNLKTGGLAWERTITVPSGRSELHRMVDILANPIIHGDKVYVASYQGHLTAIDIRQGRVLWEHQLSTYKDMAADEHALYVTDTVSQIWAFDQNTGQTLWKQDALEQRRITAPALAQDYLVVGDYGGYVHWLDKTNGRLIGRYRAGQRIVQQPVTENNLVLITAYTGAMTALTLQPKQG